MSLKDEFEFRDVEDPAGNGQPSIAVYYNDAELGAVRTGIYLQVHGGGPKNFRCFHGNPEPSDVAAKVFELDDDGRMNIA